MSRSPSLHGRCAVVTGAAGGLGQAISAALAAAGARLLLVDIDGAALDAAAKHLGATPADAATGGAGSRSRHTPTSQAAVTLVADIATADGRRNIVEAAGARAGVADILVNNAGVERASEYTALTAAEVQHAIEVNLLGAMLLTHGLLPQMRRRGRGHVISIASIAGIKPVPYNAVYNTAKAGLVGFSTSLSKELVGTGVHATVICPSAVRSAGMWARVSHQLPRNRLVESSTVAPADVAGAVVRALEHRPTRILVASPAVRAGALLSALSPAVDRGTDRLGRIAEIYRRRVETDRGNPL